MADAGLDALLLLSGPNLAYLSGAGVVELTAGRAWYLLVPRSGEPALVVQDWRRAEAVEKSWVVPEGPPPIEGCSGLNREAIREPIVLAAAPHVRVLAQ